jgi:transposase
VQAVAKTLDIHPFMLSRWRKEYREGKINPGRKVKLVSVKAESELKLVEQIKKENAQLKQENALLKKWQRFLGERRRNATSSSRETETSFR